MDRILSLQESPQMVESCLLVSETGNQPCPALNHKCSQSRHERQTTGRMKQKPQMKDSTLVLLSVMINVTLMQSWLRSIYKYQHV